MPSFRIPGPVRMPSPRPGPVNLEAPTPTVYAHPERLTGAQQDALIAQQKPLWQRINEGLEREKAINEFLEAAQKEYYYLDRWRDFGHIQEQLLQEQLWLSSRFVEEWRRSAFRSAVLRIPQISEQIEKVNALYYFYDKLCKDEYGKLNGYVKPNFNNPLEEPKFPEPWQYYEWVRQFYFKQGVNDLPELLNSTIQPADFLGKPVVCGVNQKMAKILKNAEEKLKQMGPDVWPQLAREITKREGFCPRPIGHSHKLSNHALGQAIDLNPPTNPRLEGGEARAIDEVLGWLQSQGLAGPERVGQSFLDAPVVSSEEEAEQTVVSSDEEAEREYLKMKAVSAAIQQFLSRSLDKWEDITARKKKCENDLNKAKQDLSKAEEPLKKAGVWKRSRDGHVYIPILGEGYPSQARIAVPVGFDKVADAETAVARAQQELDKLNGELKNEHAYSNVEKLVKAWGGVKQARFYQNNGLIALRKQLYQAMESAGAGLGLKYKHSKDSMHFEVPE